MRIYTNVVKLLEAIVVMHRVQSYILGTIISDSNITITSLNTLYCGGEPEQH